MVKCDICGKEFKNPQGLRGHEMLSHGINNSKRQPAAKPVAEQQLSELESRLEQVEELTRVTTERLTEQLNNLERQVGLALSNNNYDRLFRQIVQLSEQVSSNSRWLTPDGINLIVSETLGKPPVFLVDLKNLKRQVNNNQRVVNWVVKKFDLVARGSKV